MKQYTDISYATESPEQVLDLFLPDREEFPVFIYFHGGGLEGGTNKDKPYISQTLTELGAAFITAEYRKYPNAKYPEYIIDAANVVKWTAENISSYGKCSKIYVGGSSAGGYLSMMLCFDRRYLESVGLDRFAVSGYFHDAGQPTSHFNVLREKGIDSRRVIVDETAPMFYVGTEEKYPPMHFVYSDNDMQNRPEQTVLMMSTLKHFGFGDETFSHTVMKGAHCQHTRALTDDGKSVFGLMVADFLKRQGALK